MIKRVLGNGLLALVLLFSVFSFPTQSSAANENPPYHVINQYLTEAALEYDIPPEVVKAVAFEESAWTQFNDDGTPYISGDGGIGIMQVTSTQGYDNYLLKNNIQYNINAGVEILNEKMTYTGADIPKVNDGDRDVIENWYFAVMAYNGIVQENRPVLKATGAVNEDAYQFKVFNNIQLYNNDLDLADFTFEISDFGDGTNGALTFTKMHFTTDVEGTVSKHYFNEKSLLKIDIPTNMRKDSTTKSEVVTSLNTTELEIVETRGSFVYDNSHEYSNRGTLWDNHYVWYPVEASNGKDGYLASGTVEKIGQRLSGLKRYNTAVEISKEGWPTGAKTVVLTRGYEFPDALAGTPLAYKLDAPILLTDNEELTNVTKQEIERLGATKVVILGSTNAISKAVENEVDAMASVSVQRIGGEDRYETAKLIAEELGSTNGKAIVAYGLNFPDALAIAPYAAKNEIPILLTRTDRVPQYTEDALEGKTDKLVVGGPVVINDSVVNQLDATRIAGEDRYETAAKIIEELDLDSNEVFLTNGFNFADALTGSVLAAKRGAPLLLVRQNRIPAFTHQSIFRNKMDYFTVLGGPVAVNIQSELGLYFD
ncbi:cell wall-binding repeat-containing protein [Alkalihalobacillus sp. AL-G]|uniref:cell wall-binding repeat-containing protein n=1 Tax=Alkalihalobacillus sp. AL-G TaxID=2926399 RepID=UPI00272A27D4|nr:cell wall-binding repeat-containing protein [Alkalihalobacillus sp. AL-G]WLD93020.1 cell wall-binding repeat-containing protein [Alkalihalobacillus sp. AL-G]